MKDTRRKIIDAAIIIFNINPSSGLEAVADKAEVTSRTLYRYFKDRNLLLDACRQEMTLTCKNAMNAAFKLSKDPLKQLEHTLYACIDCGSKYAFFDKINQSNQKDGSNPAVDEEYADLQNRWVELIIILQKQKIVTTLLTTDWIYQLFTGMIDTTLLAISSGKVAPSKIKQFAWYSFSQSIGINSANLK